MELEIHSRNVAMTPRWKTETESRMEDLQRGHTLTSRKSRSMDTSFVIALCLAPYSSSSVWTNPRTTSEMEPCLRSRTSGEYRTGCSERPSSKAAASEEANRTLCRTLSL